MLYLFIFIYTLKNVWNNYVYFKTNKNTKITLLWTWNVCFIIYFKDVPFVSLTTFIVIDPNRIRYISMWYARRMVNHLLYCQQFAHEIHHSLAIQKTTQTCQHPGNVNSGPNKSRQSFKSHRLRRVEIEQHIPQFEEIPCDRLCVRLLQEREEFVSAILSVLSSLRALFPTAHRYSHHCVSQTK